MSKYNNENKIKVLLESWDGSMEEAKSFFNKLREENKCNTKSPSHEQGHFDFFEPVEDKKPKGDVDFSKVGKSPNAGQVFILPKNTTEATKIFVGMQEIANVSSAQLGYDTDYDYPVLTLTIANPVLIYSEEELEHIY